MSNPHASVTEQHTYVLRSESGIWLAEFDLNINDPFEVTHDVRERALARAKSLVAEGYGPVSIYLRVRSVSNILVATV